MQKQGIKQMLPLITTLAMVIVAGSMITGHNHHYKYYSKYHFNKWW